VAGQHTRDVALLGYPEGVELRQILSRTTSRAVSLPAEGVMLTVTLADLMGLRLGDSVLVRVREGERPDLWLPVTAVADELAGIQGHMRLDALSRALGEFPSVSLGLLAVQPDSVPAVIQALNKFPMVFGIASRRTIIERLREQSGRSMAVISLVLTLFAATIAIGVVYNNARATLSLRGRDLASLRVLGFTSGEVSWMLLGELAVQVCLALPAGIFLGRWFTDVVVRSTHAERFRLPVVITSQTLVVAGCIIVAVTVVTSMVVRRRIDQLDLIAALKTRE
jgi:putative ABC transport system permease protein